jgi:hypothetical protein
VPKGTNDRLQSVGVQPAKWGDTIRAEVRNGDFAWNPYANNGQGAQIGGGWRAEAIGPTEYTSSAAVMYHWSTMLPINYVNDPRIDDVADPNNGKPTWQVIFQWHQGDSRGGSTYCIHYSRKQHLAGRASVRPDERIQFSSRGSMAGGNS